MALRRFVPIEDLQLVGGALCLDFVNTSGLRESGSPRERLRSLRDVLVFAERTGVLDRKAARAVAGALDPAGVERALRRVLALREAIYRLFRARLAGEPAAKGDLALFNRELREAGRARELTWSQGGPRWTWNPTPTGLGQLLGPIVISAATLLESPERLAPLKKCGECDWLFLDTTRNNSRTWCKGTCGDRVKARRYYRRHRGGEVDDI